MSLLEADQSQTSGEPSVFLVRTYSITRAMAERVASWFASVTEIPHYQTWISTNGDEHSLNKLNRALEAHGLKEVNRHTYTEETMRERYPAMKDKQRLAHRYPSQAQDLWWQDLKSDAATVRPRYVWSIEPDVGYTGTMKDFVQYYDEYKVDFISMSYHDDDWQVASADWHPNTPTDAWRSKVPAENRMVLATFVERYSDTLLGKIHSWSTAGVIDRAEAMPGTICFMEKMSHKFIPKEQKGNPLFWKGRVSEKEWDDISLDEGQKGKLFHALKF